jgi:deoxyribonuclease-1
VIARAHLYFNKQYGMKLSKQEFKKYKAWNEQYPPSQWEIERNKRIAKVQGNLNSFIK